MPTDVTGSGRICENGKYFCKRDRNKAGTIGIYTCKGRQTVPVGDTGESSPAGEVIDEEKLGRIVLALARFVFNDAEAMARQREGHTARDMSLMDVLSIYLLARESFHDEVIRGLRQKLEKAEGQKSFLYQDQIKSAEHSKAIDLKTIKNMMASVQLCWPETSPMASKLESEEQKHYAKVMRANGYAESTIGMWMGRTFSAMRHCKTAKLLLTVPDRIDAASWKLGNDEEDSNVVYELEEVAMLFNYAAGDPIYWKYMNLSTHGARPMTLIEACWPQITLGDAPRWNLNPFGKRVTKKRRPLIPICPTLAAELEMWPRDHSRIITDGSGRAPASHQLFEKLRDRSGVKRGSAMTMRKFIRTWLMLHGVPEAIADMFIGHADEGSVTGRRHYKSKDPKYMLMAVLAIQKLYEALRPLVKRPFADAASRIVISEDQPEPMSRVVRLAEPLLAYVRVDRVAEILVSV